MEEEPKTAEEELKKALRARHPRCDWRGFKALAYVEGSRYGLPTYLIEGIFEEGEHLDPDDVPDGIAMLRITHHSEEPCFPCALTADPNRRAVNFLGVAMVAESRLQDDVLKAIRAGKRLMVSYDYDAASDDGVGPDGHLFPVWSAE